MVGPLVYSLEEAQELVPLLDEAFDKLDDLREELRTSKLKLSTLEMLWGPELREPDCPDHEEAASLLEGMQHLQDDVTAVVQDLAEKGVTVKDVASGLADVYHVREGRLVFLCWKRGETAFGAWHHVDEGFAGRRPV